MNKRNQSIQDLKVVADKNTHLDRDQNNGSLQNQNKKRKLMKKIVEKAQDEDQNKNNQNDLLCNQEIRIVNNVKECREVVEQLRSHCKEYNVLGFGREFVKYSGIKISLLLLASHRGLCVLIRLCKLKTIPVELREILEDENILKVGVHPIGDAIKLVAYHVYIASIFDLRYLAVKCNFLPLDLPALSKEHLKVKLVENHRLNHHLWKRDMLDIGNINYAAKRVRVTIELFKIFEKNLCGNKKESVQKFIDEHCSTYLNKNYRREQIENQKPEITAGDKMQNKDSLRNQDIKIVNTLEECQAIIEQLRSHCNEYNVLGFGCEKMSYGRQEVALLQFASHRGLCALIRLCKLKEVPIELQKILKDANIRKVGVKTYVDARMLEKYYGHCVAGTLDLRHLASECKFRPAELSKLSKDNLNVDFDEDWRIPVSNWKVETMSNLQIDYAAQKAYVATELFKMFEQKLVPRNDSDENSMNCVKQFIDEHCLLYLNEEFPKRKERTDKNVIPALDPDYNPFKNQEIRIVNNAEECRDVAEQLRLHCNEYNVLGFDCEWKSPGGRKVALLQLATHRGLCALIRLCKLKTIPTELREILEDDKILKAGIIPHNDAKKLTSGYGVLVASTLDLKKLAKKCNSKASGLAKLCEEHLKFKLIKCEHIHNKWEKDALDIENIKYAANDAHAAIELFKKFEEKLSAKSPSDGSSMKNLQQFIDEHCLPHLYQRKKSARNENQNPQKTANANN